MSDIISVFCIGYTVASLAIFATKMAASRRGDQ